MLPIVPPLRSESPVGRIGALMEKGKHSPIRVMIEQGNKKAVASAFDWPGWDRGGKSEDEALAVLATYRPRYAKVAELAACGEAFRTTGKLKIVEHVKGTGMTDFYT